MPLLQNASAYAIINLSGTVEIPDRLLVTHQIHQRDAAPIPYLSVSRADLQRFRKAFECLRGPPKGSKDNCIIIKGRGGFCICIDCTAQINLSISEPPQSYQENSEEIDGCDVSRLFF